MISVGIGSSLDVAVAVGASPCAAAAALILYLIMCSCCLALTLSPHIVGVVGGGAAAALLPDVSPQFADKRRRLAPKNQTRRHTQDSFRKITCNNLCRCYFCASLAPGGWARRRRCCRCCLAFLQCDNFKQFALPPPPLGSPITVSSLMWQLGNERRRWVACCMEGVGRGDEICMI